MTVRLSTGLRTALAGDTGFGATFDKGVIYIYSGPQPLTADAAVTGTLLGIVTTGGLPFTWGSPTNGLSFEAAANGAITKDASDTWQFTGLATGTAGWFRLMGNAEDSLGSSTTLPRMDGSCGVGSGDLRLSTLSIAEDAPNTVTVFKFTIPAQ